MRTINRMLLIEFMEYLNKEKNIILRNMLECCEIDIIREFEKWIEKKEQEWR